MQAGHDEHADPYIVHTCSLSATQYEQKSFKVALNFLILKLRHMFRIHTIQLFRKQQPLKCGNASIVKMSTTTYWEMLYYIQKRQQ